MLGKIYVDMNRIDLAKKYLNQAIDGIVVSFDDKQAHDEACEILIKLWFIGFYIIFTNSVVFDNKTEFRMEEIFKWKKFMIYILWQNIY